MVIYYVWKQVYFEPDKQNNEWRMVINRRQNPTEIRK